MPPLKNPKHEITAHKLVTNGFNKTQTYQEQYPNASYSSANSNAHAYMLNNGIIDRAVELASKREITSLEGVLNGVAETLKADKYIPSGKRLLEVPDHNVRSNMQQFMLSKVYGMDKSKQGQVVDKQLNVNLTLAPEHIQPLNNLITELNSIQSKITKSLSQPLPD